MARDTVQFVCTSCGADYLRWQGRCDACGLWNCISSITIPAGEGRAIGKNLTIHTGHKLGKGHERLSPERLSSVDFSAESRLLIGIDELDRVLGGGLVPGSAILLAGDPGIGKSTLLLTAMATLSQRENVLYISGEESLQQLKLRSIRLGLPEEELWVLMETRLESILESILERNPVFLAIDSIQTIATVAHPAAAGTISQVRECTARLIVEAKKRNLAILLVGHVTQDGQIAGPKVLEHMVDTVLYFEGDPHHDHR